MGFNIRHIKKYVNWVSNDRKNYKKDCKVSKEYAKLNRKLNRAMLVNNTDKIESVSSQKHEYILAKLSAICTDTLKKYENYQEPNNLRTPNTEIKVWSMWWQGEESADKLFRMCIDSARRHTGHEVVTLSKENYSKYFTIPEHMLKKQQEGKIALQHICDYMVMAIMAAEGGLFTGATVWWSQDVGDDVLRAPFFVPKAESKSQYHMSRSRWVGYVMGGNKEFPLFSFVRDTLEEYWRKCDIAIDYLMMDYLFEFAYRTLPCVKEMIDENPDNNLLRNELINVLSEPYDEQNFKRFTEGETFLYKLSWKFGKKDIVTADGRQTNYGHMLEECNL